MAENVLFLTPYEPSATGNGGNHRAYQIQCDLESLPEVRLKTLNLNRPQPAGRRSWRDRIRLRTRVQDLLKSAVDWLVQKRPGLAPLWTSLRRELDGPQAPYLWQFPLSDALLAEVTALLDQGSIRLVVLEHPSWLRLAQACQARNIPMICCPQNLESLVYYKSKSLEARVPALLHQLQGEIAFYQQCTHSLFISRVEAGFVGSLQIQGVATYPYQPAGALREELEQIRLRRRPQSGLCLLIGTYSHAPIADGMTWLIEQIAHHQLPENVQLVVVGKGSENLANSNLERVTCRGWVDDAELHDLLQKVSCVLVPMRYGFGALTRLAEMTTAGIPVIASRFATLAVGDHPLIRPVENHWEDWVQALRTLETGESPTSYPMPPAEESNPLQTLARRYLS